MAQRIAKADLKGKKKGLLPVAPSRDGGRPMLARGLAHELHRVGEMLGATGARASACRIVGSFHEAPPGPTYPRCEICYGESGKKSGS